MDVEKVGRFIKELRENKKWSQEELAGKIYSERTKINKLERGKRQPKIDDLLLLSEIFNISIEELIAGERRDKENEQQIQITFKEYLKSQNTKFKKMRLAIIILSLITMLVFSVFTTFYFFQNYKSIRIYRFCGKSENYEVTDGLLILSKDKIYFKIENIVPSVEEISIYSEINNEKKLIYKGSPSNILNDNYGYDAFISYKDFLKSNQKIYVIIDNEEIELKFIEDFVNNKIYYKEDQNISEKEQNSEVPIPTKIKESFECDSESCHFDSQKERMIFNNGIFTVMLDDEYYTYNIKNNILEYQNQNNPNSNIIITCPDEDITCLSGDCQNAEKIYNKFYNKYILKYLK